MLSSFSELLGARSDLTYPQVKNDPPPGPDLTHFEDYEKKLKEGGCASASGGVPPHEFPQSQKSPQEAARAVESPPFDLSGVPKRPERQGDAKTSMGKHAPYSGPPTPPSDFIESARASLGANASNASVLGSAWFSYVHTTVAGLAEPGAEVWHADFAAEILMKLFGDAPKNRERYRRICEGVRSGAVRPWTFYTCLCSMTTKLREGVIQNPGAYFETLVEGEEKASKKAAASAELAKSNDPPVERGTAAQPVAEKVDPTSLEKGDSIDKILGALQWFVGQGDHVPDVIVSEAAAAICKALHIKTRASKFESKGGTRKFPCIDAMEHVCRWLAAGKASWKSVFDAMEKAKGIAKTQDGKYNGPTICQEFLRELCNFKGEPTTA
jgi:hypothetical protein